MGKVITVDFAAKAADARAGRTFRFSSLIDEQLRFRTTFPILERKTRNTGKVPRKRYITINDAVADAVTLYLENTPNIRLNDFMFRGESNRCGRDNGRAMTRRSADRIFNPHLASWMPSSTRFLSPSHKI